MTVKVIANLFYKYGIIDLSENSYGTYQCTKRDYVLDKLNNARDLHQVFLYCLFRKSVNNKHFVGVNPMSVTGCR